MVIGVPCLLRTIELVPFPPLVQLVRVGPIELVMGVELSLSDLHLMRVLVPVAAMSVREYVVVTVE